MLAYTDLRTGFRPFFRRARDARLAGPVMFAAHNAAFPPARVPARAVAEAVIAPAAAPAPSLAPTPDARLLRRLRHVVRRRVKVELDGLVRASVTDGDIDITVRTVSARDPKVIDWSADRLVALVVLHDGCGARVIGGGGLMGRLELPSITCSGAFLAFCYDGEAGVTLS
jgi:hypothetical protein